MGAADRGLEAAAGPALPTIFKGEAGIPRDDEAYDDLDGVRAGRPHHRARRWPTTSGRWATPGPCGRCSEIHYFRGDDLPCDEKRGRSCRGVECSCDRFVEIWNNVFMEFDRAAPTARSTPLPAPSIDTGMGLERITAVHPGQALELRHRPVHADPDGDRRARRASPTARRSTTRRTSRCASSPITSAR